MKYTVFGTCIALPSGSDLHKNNWGNYFDQLHPLDNKWFVTYHQTNLQIAVHVMMMSTHDTINIVQLADLHRKALIDTKYPKSVDLLQNLVTSSAYTNQQTYLATNGDWVESTWQKSVIGNTSKDPAYESERDRDYVSAYKKTNYIAQAKWELHTAIAIIDAHAKATGKDIRLIPRLHRDHQFNNLSTLNKAQMMSISKLYNPNRIFWYTDKNNKPIGAQQYDSNDLQNIVENYLQPWLDKDI